jgi:hypothetical protein
MKGTDAKYVIIDKSEISGRYINSEPNASGSKSSQQYAHGLYRSFCESVLLLLTPQLKKKGCKTRDHPLEQP